MTVHQTNMEPWKVTVVDTGYNTMTGGRIKRIQKYVGDEPFLMTYGDGVCDVEIDKLIEFHKSHGKLATLTAVKMAQDKGVLDIQDGAVKAFREKMPLMARLSTQVIWYSNHRYLIILLVMLVCLRRLHLPNWQRKVS